MIISAMSASSWTTVRMSIGYAPAIPLTIGISGTPSVRA
jgi:hypothetical protein